MPLSRANVSLMPSAPVKTLTDSSRVYGRRRSRRRSRSSPWPCWRRCQTPCCAAVHGLVDRAPLAPLDALLPECSDGDRVDGLTCVPRGAKGSGRDEPFVDLPRWSADAAEADTYERAATTRPNVAWDLTGHHGLVPVAKVLTVRREMQDAVQEVAKARRDPRPRVNILLTTKYSFPNVSPLV